MVKFLKLLFIGIIMVIIAGAIVWALMAWGYPWWVGAAVCLGILGLWTGFLFIKRLILRRRERDFVKRVIEQNEKVIAHAPVDEQRRLRELQESWKNSIDLLRQSYLRKHGNPLYVLPWYLILGESGAGKTSAIKNTNLNSPISELSQMVEIPVTRNCEWWFFEQAIILDTAGRYTIPLDSGPDLEEWEEFLTLLAKYRKREPINGVIVTIAADKLQSFIEAQLSDEGLSARRRIDQLMHVLGAKIPVYVMVSKMDLVQGMVEFSSMLPKEYLNQAMGYINADLETDWKQVFENAFTSIAGNLRDIQFRIVHGDREPEPEVFMFINSFERLKLGLNVYIEAVFKSNPYQETPWFRGVCFYQRDPAGAGSFRDHLSPTDSTPVI